MKRLIVENGKKDPDNARCYFIDDQSDIQKIVEDAKRAEEQSSAECCLDVRVERRIVDDYYDDLQVHSYEEVMFSFEELNIDEDGPCAGIARVWIVFGPHEIMDSLIDELTGKRREPKIPADNRFVDAKAEARFYVDKIDREKEFVVCTLTCWDGRTVLPPAFLEDNGHSLAMAKGKLTELKWKVSWKRWHDLSRKGLVPQEHGDMVAKVFQIRAYDFVDDNGIKQVILYVALDPIKIEEPAFFDNDYGQFDITTTN